MELQGKIIEATERRSGESQRGTWEAQDFVLETHDQYPRKMVFSVFGADRLQRFNIQVGQEVNVSFDIDARQYNGRWFNSIRAFDVRPVVTNAEPVAEPFPNVAGGADPFAAPAPQSSADPFASSSENSKDDLPF